MISTTKIILSQQRRFDVFCLRTLSSAVAFLSLSFLTCCCSVLANEQQLDVPTNSLASRTVADGFDSKKGVEAAQSRSGMIADSKPDAATGTADAITAAAKGAATTPADNATAIATTTPAVAATAGATVTSATSASEAVTPAGTTFDPTVATIAATNSPTDPPADSSATTTAVSQNQAVSGRKPRTFGNVLKTNIVETFQLDPRLKKDLTQGRYDLRPIKLQQDYFSVGFNPTIEWDKNPGVPTVPAYGYDNMSLYVVGPITKHLSTWVQALPLVNSQGAMSHFEILQGLANYGNDKTFLQVLGGQGFNWQNSGFGGADRTITQTSPGVYTAINGFDPTAVSKTVSLSATGHNWTTGKVFGYWQPGAQTSSDPNITYQRGYGVGVSGEKLIGKTGISGIQSNLTMGTTPAFNINTAPSGALVGRQSSPFIWWTSWINKSFQDKKGYVRFNPSFGLTTFHQRRNLDDPAVNYGASNGYGYTFDLVAIPVRSYLTSILRYDQFRTNGVSHDNTTYTFTAGEALDLHMPNKGRLRVTFDYQLIGQHAIQPSQRFILGFWPIW